MVLLLVILTYGMETGFFRFAQDRKDYEKVYSTALFSLLITSSLFLILVNIFIKPVSDALKYSNNHDYIRMFAAIVAIDAFCAIPFARLRNDNKPLIFSIIKVTNVIVTIIAVIILLMIGPKLYETGPSWFRKIYNPAYGVGYVFLANLIGSAFTLLLLLPYIVTVSYTHLRAHETVLDLVRRLLLEKKSWFRQTLSYLKKPHQFVSTDD